MGRAGISIARIVNGTSLIYAWDSSSAAGRRDRGKREREREWRKASVSRQREERPRESG